MKIQCPECAARLVLKQVPTRAVQCPQCNAVAYRPPAGGAQGLNAKEAGEVSRPVLLWLGAGAFTLLVLGLVLTWVLLRDGPDVQTNPDGAEIPAPLALAPLAPPQNDVAPPALPPIGKAPEDGRRAVETPVEPPVVRLRDTAIFLESKAKGERFCYIVDRSGSMNTPVATKPGDQPKVPESYSPAEVQLILDALNRLHKLELSDIRISNPGKRKVDFAQLPRRASGAAAFPKALNSSSNNSLALVKKELGRSLEQLKKDTQFYVIFFDDREQPMPFPSWLDATADHVSAVKSWMEPLLPKGSTRPESAFDKAFALDPPPDVIFFMTDGLIPANVPASVAQKNAKKIVINTIMFFAGRGPNSFNQTLSIAYRKKLAVDYALQSLARVEKEYGAVEDLQTKVKNALLAQRPSLKQQLERAEIQLVASAKFTAQSALKRIEQSEASNAPLAQAIQPESGADKLLKKIADDSGGTFSRFEASQEK